MIHYASIAIPFFKREGFTSLKERLKSRLLYTMESGKDTWKPVAPLGPSISPDMLKPEPHNRSDLIRYTFDCTCFVASESDRHAVILYNEGLVRLSLLDKPLTCPDIPVSIHLAFAEVVSLQGNEDKISLLLRFIRTSLDGLIVEAQCVREHLVLDDNVVSLNCPSKKS